MNIRTRYRERLQTLESAQVLDPCGDPVARSVVPRSITAEIEFAQVDEVEQGIRQGVQAQSVEAESAGPDSSFLGDAIQGDGHAVGGGGHGAMRGMGSVADR